MTTIERLEQLLTLAAPYGMRVGRTLGRTLYSLDFTGEGHVIGMVDTGNQALLLTQAVNALPALLRVAKAARAYRDGMARGEASDAELGAALRDLDEVQP